MGTGKPSETFTLGEIKSIVANAKALTAKYTKRRKMESLSPVYRQMVQGRMNVWVHAQIEVLENLIAQGGMQELAYLRGVVAGLRILQKEILNGTFYDERS